MSTSPQTSSSRCLPTVTPHLVCGGAAAAIEFYRKAFNAEEIMRVPVPGGKLIHASLRLGDSVVMLVDEFPEQGCLSPRALKSTSVTLHLQVPDVDALTAQAIAAGATVILPVQDMFWGDRYGIVEDPFGHRWSIATHLRDVPPEELQQAAAKMCAS